jgi:hypothetical protein
MAKGSGVEVVTNPTEKITSEQFFKALDAELDHVFEEMRAKKFRSQMQLVFEMGKRMQPQQMIRQTSTRLGVTDVAVLSLFAREPEVRGKIGERMKERAEKESVSLKALHPNLPTVVRQDCREAAIMVVQATEAAAKADDGHNHGTPSPLAPPGAPAPSSLPSAEPSHPPHATNPRVAPMVAAVLQECDTLGKTQPELACYVAAKDAAALKACE